MSNKEKINTLRNKLNKSIEENKDYETIYNLSIELDKLIASYYEEELKNDMQNSTNLY